MGRAGKPWSSVQPRTPGERSRETWRLRPGALTSLSSLLSSPPPPDLRSLLATTHTAPPLPVESQVPERCSTPPPGPSVENNHRPLPPPFPALHRRRHFCLAAPWQGVRTSPEGLGFGVVVSLGERDWTDILQEEEGDAKDFLHQLFLGFLHNLQE